MRPGTDPDGCPSFEAEVAFDQAGIGQLFRWGVSVDGPAGRGVWAIAREVDDEGSSARECSFVLRPGGQSEVHYLTHCGRLGARKQDVGAWGPGIGFAVWAPNARNVALVLADPARGYVADDGTGARKLIPMAKDADGIWRAGTGSADELAAFNPLLGAPYMFRVEKDDGTIAFRTDLWSRMQVGRGDVDPGGRAYPGPPESLDGPKSCSVVCDPDVVVDETGHTHQASDFWRDEFRPDRPVPSLLQDLVIYELHVGALGYGNPGPGTLDDAIAFLDHLQALGVNAVELMPIAQFEARANWGYGTSHFFAIDQAAGGTDRLKSLVKQCHRRGIAVILDVCYNHFDPDAERAEWAYDSNDPTRNIYFWYEGQPSDYSDPTGGYIDNISSGWAPRFDQEMVRQLFVSSAAMLITECHVDGFRLDQTTCIHAYPALHANGRHADRAAAFGVKFLKQWTRTMRLLRPGLFLTAEDYSGWSALTTPSLDGDGLGFDAIWYGDFHHNLIEYQGSQFASLIKEAGYGDARPLAMDHFAGALGASGGVKVVYHESHDDCGNREGSARTLWLAVNGAPLVGETRRWAEARARFAAGMTLLSAGTPMFFMGEEVGAAKFYRYNDFLDNREDILGSGRGSGAPLFRYYIDLIALSERHASIRSRNIEVWVADNVNRVIAFRRCDGEEEILVVGSLANAPFADGYTIRHPGLGDAAWIELFNSDAHAYGGWNVGNEGSALASRDGALNVVIPAAGLVVLRRV
jgi:1,4-alpha-glucan branching enzyme